ncbi:thioredoxin [Rhizoctonia solani]|uniref:Thioredoxin n=1 Tax=Rhizoctonia solani TaxID=456999 RepID=A0A8H8NXZ1_9AGAM|nr:thioredoxin [Rhizoctonia solani]QRW21580.1 thioredoxin [Rhizoctonia solani]
MSLQPSLSFLTIGNPASPHTLELYLDFVCPFSAKIYNNAVTAVLRPLFTEGKYASKAKLILRLQPQPCKNKNKNGVFRHGSSTFTHEAALAVGRVAPERFLEYATELFKAQEQFFDIPTSTLTPLQIREKLVALAPEGVDKKAVADLLELKSTSNGGVSVTDDLKYNIKLGRQNGVHVTPSALWDGLLANDVSSSWGKDEWEKFLETKVTV